MADARSAGSSDWRGKHPKKDLGRWESLEMVQRYTRSVTFEYSMKHSKALTSLVLGTSGA